MIVAFSGGERSQSPSKLPLNERAVSTIVIVSPMTDPLNTWLALTPAFEVLSRTQFDMRRQHDARHRSQQLLAFQFGFEIPLLFVQTVQLGLTRPIRRKVTTRPRIARLGPHPPNRRPHLLDLNRQLPLPQGAKGLTGLEQVTFLDRNRLDGPLGRGPHRNHERRAHRRITRNPRR